MSRAIPSDILAAVQAVTKGAPRPVALHEPLFIGNEKAYVSSCIDEGWVSSVGRFVDQFEKALALASGAQYAVVVVNGTCALQMALHHVGVQPGDEVLMPSLTFVATANAASHLGAIPHFVEVEENSLGICPDKLSAYLRGIATSRAGVTHNIHSGRAIRALVPVDVFGHPCQIGALRKVADEFHLSVVEDATEALGSTRGNLPIGGEGLSVLSFNGNKIITTGGGGAILVQDEDSYRKLKHLTTTAKTPHRWAFEHDEVAWNYRLPNLNAALGVAQLEQLPRFVAAKRALAKRYEQAFSGLCGATILQEPAGTQSNYWLVSMLLDDDNFEQRDEHLAALHDAGILARPAWTPMHQLPMYQSMPRADLGLTESMVRRIISLPSSAKLGLALI
jgi:perosamine synthetase